MVQINFANKQVNAKIVYYGPGMSGKTTNLEVVHERAPKENHGELTSISTDGDRTLFFDYMPLDLGTVAGMRTCFQLYTVPGQVYYNSTRKLVLQGVDGVIFVADSSAANMEANLESLRNLEENLNEYGKSLASLPHAIQYNKRDLPDALPVEALNAKLNVYGAPCFEAVASTGQGVFPTLKAAAAAVLKNLMTEATAAAAPRAAEHAPAAPLPMAHAAAPRPLTVGVGGAGVNAAGAGGCAAPAAQLGPAAQRAAFSSSGAQAQIPLSQTGFRSLPASTQGQAALSQTGYRPALAGRGGHAPVAGAGRPNAAAARPVPPHASAARGVRERQPARPAAPAPAEKGRKHVLAIGVYVACAAAAGVLIAATVLKLL